MEFHSDLHQLFEHAKQFDNFDDFKKSWLRQLRHGQYWHITDNPKFFIDLKKGPRDMSSLSYPSKMSVGKLMITSDLEHWHIYYNFDAEENEINERPYAVELDMSQVPFDEWEQVNRGFGNEFFVNNTSKVKVLRILPINEALKISENYNENIKPQSEDELYHLWEEAQKTKGNDKDKIMNYENLDAISNKKKQQLLHSWAQWGEEDQDVSRRDVPVGVMESRINDFKEKVLYDLEGTLNGISGLYKEIKNNETDDILNSIAVLRIFLDTDLQNLRNVTEKEGFVEDIY